MKKTLTATITLALTFALGACSAPVKELSSAAAHDEPQAGKILHLSKKRALKAEQLYGSASLTDIETFMRGRVFVQLSDGELMRVATMFHASHPDLTPSEVLGVINKHPQGAALEVEKALLKLERLNSEQ